MSYTIGMSFKTKILLIVLLVMALQLGFLITGKYILEPKLQQLEQTQAQHNLKIGINALEDQLESLKSYAKYIGADRAKLEQLLQDRQIDLAYIVTNNGETIWHKALDPYVVDNKQELIMPNFISRLQQQKNNLKTTGIHISAQGTVMLAVVPVMNQLEDKYVVLGKFLTKRLLRDLNVQANITMKILPIEAQVMHSDQVKILTRLNKSDAKYHIDFSDNFVNAYNSIDDITSQANILVSVRKSRDYQHIWNNATEILLAVWFVTCVLLVFIFSGIIKLSIMQPIHKIVKHLHNMVSNQSYTKQLLLKKTGALRPIALEINTLGVKIMERNKVLEKQAYEGGAAKLAAIVLEEASEIIEPVAKDVQEVERNLKALPIMDLDMLGVGRKIREQQRQSLVKITGVRVRLARIITTIGKHTLRLNIK